MPLSGPDYMREDENDVTSGEVERAGVDMSRATPTGIASDNGVHSVFHIR